jgi:SAM-dependent methyltransferase
MVNGLEEYADPDLYDAEYGSYQGDFDLYLNLINGGDVLDLACGTGRLTIPFAEKGLKAVGLDASQAMLARVQGKSKNLLIEWVHRDIRDFQLNHKFDLITLAGNAFQALPSNEDQERMLLCVRGHLKPSGIFAFNTRNPTPNDMRTTADYEFWHDFIDPGGQLVKVYGKQTYHPSTDIVCYTTKRIWSDAETITDIELRFTSLETLEVNLEKLGFDVMNRYGDFHKNPYSDTSENIILVCRVTR